MSPRKISVLSAKSTSANETQPTLFNCDWNRIFATFLKHEICSSNISREPYSTWFLSTYSQPFTRHICETRPLWTIHFFGRQTQPTPARSEPLLKARTLPGNFSFKAVPVPLNCFVACEIDMALRDSVPYFTSKNALKGNNGLELGKSHEALCLILKERRYTDCKNWKFGTCENLASNSSRLCLNMNWMFTSITREIFCVD